MNTAWYYIIDWGACATLLAALIAALSASVAYQAMKVQKETIKYLQRRGDEEFTVAWTNQVIDWANACCDVVSCLEAKARFVSNSGKEDVVLHLGKLSSLIDRGRLLFENDRSDDYGIYKSRAYQGYRPFKLDCLVEVYDAFLPVVNVDNENKSLAYLINIAVAEKTNEAKREFVSQVQEVVDPAWFHRKAVKYEKGSEDKNVKNQ